MEVSASGLPRRFSGSGQSRKSFVDASPRPKAAPAAVFDGRVDFKSHAKLASEFAKDPIRVPGSLDKPHRMTRMTHLREEPVHWPKFSESHPKSG
jgi:hypothetical protein